MVHLTQARNASQFRRRAADFSWAEGNTSRMVCSCQVVCPGVCRRFLCTGLACTRTPAVSRGFRLWLRVDMWDSKV